MTNIYNMTDTWDDVGVDWAAIKMNVGDVASSAASKIIDLQVDSASQFNVDKDGNATIAGGISAASASFSTPIPLSSGGTNSTSATDARTALAVVGTVELAASGGSNLVGFLQSGTGATARTAQAKMRDVVSVKDFGAVGDGVTDDSAAFAAAIAYANTQSSAAIGSGFPLGTTTIIVPSGDYVVTSGVTCSTLMCAIIGDGRESTRIILGVGQYFLTVASVIYQFKMSGLSFSGGKGALAHTYTLVNVQGVVEISDNNFSDYTECAIGTLAADHPYWRVKNNVFYGSSSLTSKGVIFTGNPDLCVIEDNAFLCNLYHIKIKQAQNSKIQRNDFIRFVAGSGSPVLTDVWIIPSATQVNAGSGLSITGNKFGNENLDADDCRILIADEGAGTNGFDKNHSTSASTGYLIGAAIDNYVAANDGQTKGFIYSYTPNIRDVTIKNTWNGYYPYVIQYDAAVTVPNDRVHDGNIIDTSMIVDATEFVAPLPTSTPQNTNARDPLGVLSGTVSFSQNHTTGFAPGLTDLWGTSSSAVNKFVKVNTTSTPITDSTGDADAAEFTFGAAGFTYGYANNPVNGRLTWAEIEVAAASANTLSAVEIRVQCDNGEVLMKRVVRVPATWQRFRFPFVVRALVSPASLQVVPVDLAVGSMDSVKLGRARVYQATEPTDFGARYLQAFAVYNPGTISAGATAITTVTCAGAALGDFALTSFGVSLQGLTATAYVSATDTVTICLYNGTGSGVTIGNSVARVKVIKSVNYTL